MPILDIEIVGDLDSKHRDGLATKIADAAGEALKSKPQGTWVKLHFIPEEQYSENGGGPPDDVLPVFVSLVQAELPSGLKLENLITTLTEAVAKCVARSSENIHTIIEPAAVGRIAFGGKLRR